MYNVIIKMYRNVSAADEMSLIAKYGALSGGGTNRDTLFYLLSVLLDTICVLEYNYSNQR